MLRIAHSERYPIPLPPEHRFPIQKYELVRMQLEHEGLVQPEQFFAPDFVDDAVITATHCAEYWARARNHGLTDAEIRMIGFPRCPELLSRSWSSASGTVAAAVQALDMGAGMNLAGGTHHAFFDRGEGFCLLNDIAIAANHLLQTGRIRRALVVDLDVHQGDGTAALFAGRDEVFTFSMHCADNYPFVPEASDLDLALPAGTGDDGYLAQLRAHLPALLEQHRPDIVFYQSGVDVLAGDLLGKLALSLRGVYLRDEMVIRSCYSRGIPLVVVMGGGYNRNLKDLIRAHSQTYRLTLDYYMHQPSLTGTVL